MRHLAQVCLQLVMEIPTQAATPIHEPISLQCPLNLERGRASQEMGLIGLPMREYPSHHRRLESAICEGGVVYIWREV
jgi:hypothetical protein